MVDAWIEQLVSVFGVSPLTAMIATRALRVALILVVTIVIYFFFRRLIRLIQRQIQRIDGVEDSTIDRRAQTILKFVHSLGVVIIVSTMVIVLLEQFDVNIAPLLASVGVAGLAIGLGAQTLVKDAIAGFFILVEDQFHVGDVIRVGTVTGAVETLSMRTTRVRDLDGILHIIPNGEIRIVANLTVRWSRARVDVLVPYEAPLDAVFSALREVAAEVAQGEAVEASLLEPFSVTGPEEMKDFGLLLRVTAKVQPGHQWDVMRTLRRAILRDFKQRGLDIAVPRQQIVVMPSADNVRTVD